MEDIDKIIAEELERGPDGISISEERVIEVKRQNEAAYQISKAIADKILTSGPGLPFLPGVEDALIRLIKRAQLNVNFADTTFARILTRIEEGQEKHKGDDIARGRLEQVINSIKFRANYYFQEWMIEEYKEVHIVDLLVHCKKMLDDIGETGPQHLKGAILKQMPLLERRIELQEERVRLSQSFPDYPGGNNDANNTGFAPEESTSDEFSYRRKVLLLTLLIFGRLDLPEESIPEMKTFFFNIFGGDKQTVERAVQNATKYKDGNRQSLQQYKNSLVFVQNYLSRIKHIEGIRASEALSIIDREIQWLLEE